MTSSFAIYTFIYTLALGYTVGIPLSALLDYATNCAKRNRPSSISVILAWPFVLIFALVFLPLVARDWFHAKLSKDD